jgi:2-keto-4-pentenoate hydratase/2-oxohepta-3-ene-1,7-dioic acid hydratase in catechol pathway
MDVKRIFCIGRNYSAHIEELGNTPDEAFVVFMKPASSVVPLGQPLPVPRGRGSLHHEAELVVRLSGGGADIAESDALHHVSHITLGLDLTLRELQNQLKDKGQPWELSKSFDHSAPLGEWKPHQKQDLQALEFTCHVNGQLRQHGKTGEMLFGVARQIHILSRSWALRDGDIVYTGTPAGVGPLLPGDRIVIDSAAIGRFEWNCV